MDGVFSAGSKRQFMGPQGSKESPHGPDAPRAGRDTIDPVTRASADIMKTRKIAAPRSRRAGASRDNSIDRQLGNPFAQIPDVAPSTGTNGFTPTPFGASASQSFPPNNNANLFSQPASQGFTFGASGGQSSSSSFPPASNPFGQQQQQPNAFGSSAAEAQPQPKTSGFTFGASSSAAPAQNPFSFGVSTPQPTPPTPAFSFNNNTQKPASNGSLFSFGNNTTTQNKPSTTTTENSTPFSNASNGFQFGAGSASNSNPFAAKSNASSTPSFGQSKPAQSSNLFANQATSSESPGGMFSLKPTTNNSLFAAPAASTPAQGSFTFGTSSAASPSPAPGTAQSSSAHVDDMMTSPPITPPKKPAPSSTTPVSKPAVPENPFASLKMMPPTPSIGVNGAAASPSSQLFGSFGQNSPKTSMQQAAPSTPNPFATHPEPATVKGQPPASAASSFTPTAAPSAESQTATPSLFAPAPSKESSVAKHTTQAQTPANATPAQSKPDTVPAESVATEAQRQYRRLNQSFKARLLSMNEDYDWSPMFQAYLSQVERMKDAYAFNPATKRAIGLDAEDSQSKRTRSAEPQVEQPSRLPATPPAQQPATSLFSPQPSTTPTSSPSKSQTANLFASIVGNTPQQTSPMQSASPFSTQPSASAPQSSTPGPGLNIFAAQATGSTQTPNISHAAGPGVTLKSTAFGATPQKANKGEAQPPNPFANLKQMPAQPSPSKPAVNAPVPAIQSTPSQTTDKEDAQPPNPFANLKQMPASPSPSKSAVGASTPAALSMPKFEMPKFNSSTGTDAFAAFGAQAEKSKLEAEKAAEKKELEARFDDEFESDNETEAAFNKRVLAEIRAKRAKAKEEKAAAPAQAVFEPGKGFSFTSASSTSGKAAESQETPPSSAETTPATAKPALFTPGPTTAINGQSIFDTAAKPAASSTNLFGNIAQSTTAPDDDGAGENSGKADASSQPDSSSSSGLGKSLFDRVSKPSAEEGTTNGHNPAMFGTPSTAEDHTWKNDSPIKFGGSVGSGLSTTPSKNNGLGEATTPAPKPYTNIFGSAKANATPSLFSQSPAKPVMGFGFGTSSNGTSAAASQSPSSTREGSVATTPDEATAAATPNGDGINLDGAPPDAQVSLTDLSAEERRANDVLFEVSSARIQAYDSKAKTWQKRGLGPLRVLKNKESGKAWILARSNPQGKVIVNTALLKGMSYDHPAKGRVKFPIVDRDGGKMTTVLVTVKEDEDASKLAEVLSSNRPE